MYRHRSYKFIRINWFFLNSFFFQQNQADSEAMKDERTKAWSVRSKLTRYPIQRNENKHNLTCFSEHETGNQNESTRLDVLYRPVVTVTKSRYTVVDGESFELKCDVDANPRAHSVGWRKQGSTTTPYSSTFDGISAIYNLRANRDLHNSTLECVATSEKGEAEPALVHIEVQCKWNICNWKYCQQYFKITCFSRVQDNWLSHLPHFTWSSLSLLILIVFRVKFKC